MIGLPKTTEFNKRIPKQKFYENLDISPALKRVFVEQVKVIYWRNKIATTTMNLSEGKEVKEIEVFEVRLNIPTLNESLLRQIDRQIPYHILFLLEYQGKYQAWIGYKEVRARGNKEFKVNEYYYTEWKDEEDLQLRLEGLDLDSVYENFVRQIAGDKLDIKNSSEDLKESVERSQYKQVLQRQIDNLRIKIRKEKQFNKQVELNRDLKRLTRELEEM
ncbi:DUF4391 domain-containing protein [Peptostreptococcus stomatis]|nr:MAG TPA: protein of unknown function (DUF4391) [Caudoviricetes sp.]